jgi:hypothetical protein
MESCGGLATRQERRLPGRPLGRAQLDKLPHNRTHLGGRRPRKPPTPLVRLRAQDRRIFFRDEGKYLEISRGLDRKEAHG